MATPVERFENLAAELKELSKKLASEDVSGIPTQRAKRLRKTISETYQKLRKIVEDLDPIKHPGFIFDPSNPSVVGRIVAITLVAQARKPLASADRFYGSGVYALYYNGSYPAYASISRREHPIYVGKADPADPASKTATEQGDRLSNRLNDHRRNISKATTTLKLADFEYRALVVQTGWQNAAENYLIHLFQPIWNNEIDICYGFGKHGDDPETRANLRSPWDTLHPGRDWAYRDPGMKDARSAKRIIGDIKAHLSNYPPIDTLDEVIRRFLEEIRAVS